MLLIDAWVKELQGRPAANLFVVVRWFLISPTILYGCHASLATITQDESHGKQM